MHGLLDLSSDSSAGQPGARCALQAWVLSYQTCQYGHTGTRVLNSIIAYIDMLACYMPVAALACSRSILQYPGNCGGFWTRQFNFVNFQFSICQTQAGLHVQDSIRVPVSSNTQLYRISRAVSSNTQRSGRGYSERLL